eukprot:9522263-Alexandrium_andersonii.AAC.1
MRNEGAWLVGRAQRWATWLTVTRTPGDPVWALASLDRRKCKKTQTLAILKRISRNAGSAWG